MNQPKIELRLRRLIIAISNFDAVINACDMLIDGNVDQNASYYRIFTAGIVVSYMRPFLRADGLGPLPQEFQEFPDNPDLKELHEDLKHGRHWVFAHHSAEDSPSLVQPEKQQGVKDIEVHFEETGRPTGYRVKPIQWNRDRLHAIIDLCQFQKNRLDPQAVELISYLGNGKVYQGYHILGQTFP